MSDLDRILHLAGVKLTESRVDELHGSRSDAEFMGRLGNDPTKKPAEHQKKMKTGNFWKGVKPKNLEIEDEEDQLMHEYEEFMDESEMEDECMMDEVVNFYDPDLLEMKMKVDNVRNELKQISEFYRKKGFILTIGNLVVTDSDHFSYRLTRMK